MDKVLPSQNPPGNLKAEKTPLFVTVGFDDNDKSGFIPQKGIEGMKWAVDAFLNRKNPDGSHCTCSFFFTTSYISDDAQEATHAVKKSWKYAYDNGFEVGCHTHSHSDGTNFTTEEWMAEMKKCIDWLTKPYIEGCDSDANGVGIKISDIQSFRAPFLRYNDNTIKAVEKMGFVYDSSMQEGMHYEQDGTNYFFPYTLDEGSPGNRYTRTYSFETDEIKSHPGVWEIPIQAFVVPPDDVCHQYGIEKGLRKKCSQQQDYFSAEDGKITGFDYNCWSEFQMTADEYLATLKYSLDLRLKGNRAPFILGAHTGIYAVGYDSDPVITVSEPERRRAIEEFLDYALSKQDVFVVSHMKIIEWMRNSQPYTP